MLPVYAPAKPGVLIFDNDETLITSEWYVQEVMRRWFAADLGISAEEAHHELDLGYRKEGGSYSYMARRYDKDETWKVRARESIHAQLTAEMEAFVQVNPRLVGQFAYLQARGHIIGMLTAAPGVYAKRAVELLEIGAHLHPHLLLALEDVDAKSKRTPDPYLTLLAKTAQIAPDRWHVMVEDQVGNLQPAAALGFCTVLVGPEEVKEPYVHAWYPHVHDFLDAIIAGRFAPALAPLG